MQHDELIRTIADIMKCFDSEHPTHKRFKPGIGPIGEPQLVGEIARGLTKQGIQSQTHRTPDLDAQGLWAIEFKVVRPFGDNGNEAENWSQNLLHPYEGNVSLIGDALKLVSLNDFHRKCLVMVGYEHSRPKISLEPLLHSFEVISRSVMNIPLGNRIEERRDDLVHPEHQVLRCVGWEVMDPKRPLAFDERGRQEIICSEGDF